MHKATMLKALAIKELRESAAILGLAALAMLWLLGSLTGSQLVPFAFDSRANESVPFLNGNFGGLLIFLGGALAIALGLKQSAWENSGKKYYFLLHRPIDRRTILLAKIAFGLTCLLLLTIGPLLVYAFWAATPGNHATPFFWGMTSAAWLVCYCLPTMYLAALLSGLRPAHWLGTRLLPLIGAGIFTLISAGCYWEIHWALGICCLLVLDVVLLRLLLAIALQRDY